MNGTRTVKPEISEEDWAKLVEIFKELEEMDIDGRRIKKK